jgi:cytochrome c oxidase cbb3-type subunit 3
MADQEHKKIKDPLTGVETTGHVWDDNIREFDNPLPRWWLWAFYGTVIFTVWYWVVYPSWPTGLVDKGFLVGTKTITYKSDAGEEKTTHWNTRALLAHEMQNNPSELTRQKMVKEIAATPFDTIAADPQKSKFVLAYGKGIFGDYCAACHQRGGQGVVGHYPNLIDDAWLWGGGATEIETSIRKGRIGTMPAHKDSLTVVEIEQVANYVLSLSKQSSNVAAIEKGKAVFNTKGCSGCHMPTATGMTALGSANLTDHIWTQSDVNGAKDEAGKLDAVKQVVADGIKREMPAWETRLKDDEIKILVSYIKLLSQKN